MSTNFNDIIFLVVAYLLAYGVGSIVSKLWNWLRLLIVFMAVSSFITGWTFGPVNLRSFLILIVPVILFAYPTIKSLLGSPSGFPNPFSWLSDKIGEWKYLKQRKREQEREREVLERMERITKIQAEEAERQRRHEREKAEREAKDRAEYQRQQQNKYRNSNQGSSQNQAGQQQETTNTKANATQDPYEILGVSRSMSKDEIRKAYLNLMNQYAPDRVSHLSKEFQKMAHEKCVAFNLAWEKIQKESV